MNLRLDDLLNDGEFREYALQGDYTPEELRAWLRVGGDRVTLETVEQAVARLEAETCISFPPTPESPVEPKQTPTKVQSGMDGQSSKCERWIILPDLHVPFHNVTLVSKVCQLIRDIQPHGVVISGDFLDMHSLSRYAADSLYQLRDVTLSGEYQAGQQVMADIERALPAGAKRHFLWGNHEDRYWREIEKGDRGKYGESLVSPTVALKLHERGYTVGERWTQDSVLLGSHLEVIHGIYCPVHAAKKHLDEFQGSILFGHSHRFQSYVLGKRAAFNVGWLGDVTSHGFAYSPRTKRGQWCNGFALVNIDTRGDYWVEPIQAYNNSFFANGKMY